MPNASQKLFEKFMIDKQTVGGRGEEMAAEYYENNGFYIAAKNFHSPFGEIDLIAESEDEVVFVEVKVRRDTAGYNPKEAVTASKIQKIRKTAEHYIYKSHIYNTLQPRFDVAEIVLDENNNFKNAKLKITKNAF